MRYLLPILIMLVAGFKATGQDPIETREGKVSYITTQSVYVRFASTEGIFDGDSLYIRQENSFIPALQINSHSSISCVCTPLPENEFQVSDVVYAKVGPPIIPEALEESHVTDTVQMVEPPESDSLSGSAADQVKMKQQISGRFSVSSYSNLNNQEADKSQKMRYTFSMRANNLGNSKFSVESYISFKHSNSNWEDIRNNIFNGLKIYNLSVKYDFDETMQISAGRKINHSLSSVGAIDGIQFEKKFSSFTLGAFAGTRPDYEDYGINPDLLQGGIYLGHELIRPNGSMQNTLAYIEQTNQLITDRRFLYFQHSSQPMESLFFFASAETDLYKKVNDANVSVFELSNAYLSVRYRIIRQLSVGMSYSSRQNIIYYETYKDFVERLLETSTLQGWRFRINSRPVKNLVVGVSGGYRYRKEDPQPSRHVYGYATYGRVPGIMASLTLSATLLETSYLRGNIYSLGISKDLLTGKINGGLKYRYVDYLFQISESSLAQNIFEASISWKVYRKLSLSVYYEGTFEDRSTNNRLYINLTQRF